MGKFNVAVTSGSSRDKVEEDRLRELGFKFRPVKSFFEGTPYMAIDRKAPPVTVQIDTLDELKAFVKKHGQIVINGEWDEIEIYNDYRE